MVKRLPLTHITNYGHVTVLPTVQLICYWWRVFNKEVFGDVLLPCTLRVTRCDKHNAIGLMWPHDQGRATIDIHPRRASRATILATLLHEMVHQYQHQHGEPLNHGPTFTRWRDPIVGITGLTI